MDLCPFFLYIFIWDDMKKIITTILGILSVICIFYGFYLALQNAGKNDRLFAIYIVVFAIGIIGLCVCALLIVYGKKKKQKQEEANENNLQNEIHSKEE